MLVLSRKFGERIVITVRGVEVIVTMVEPRGHGGRIGVDAPDEVAIDREEVHLRKLRERGTA